MLSKNEKEGIRTFVYELQGCLMEENGQNPVSNLCNRRMLEDRENL